MHKFIAPLLGSAIAPTLFGIALLCCGMNSTVTATLAGQIVMEGFIDIRLPPWARRLMTRAIAIIPAACDDLVRRDRDREALDPQSGDPRPGAAVRHRAAGDVHRRPRKMGGLGRAALGDRAGGAHGGCF